jgi:hypothetical protein
VERRHGERVFALASAAAEPSKAVAIAVVSALKLRDSGVERNMLLM